MGVPAYNEGPWRYTHASGATSTVLKTAPGILHSITINTPATGAIVAFDNTAASGTNIASVNPTTSLSPVTLIYDVGFNTGLAVTTSASQDVTFAWS